MRAAGRFVDSDYMASHYSGDSFPPVSRALSPRSIEPHRKEEADIHGPSDIRAKAQQGIYIIFFLGP